LGVFREKSGEYGTQRGRSGTKKKRRKAVQGVGSQASKKNIVTGGRSFLWGGGGGGGKKKKGRARKRMDKIGTTLLKIAQKILQRGSGKPEGGLYRFRGGD